MEASPDITPEKALRRPLQLLGPLLRPHKAALAGGVLAMVISSAMLLALGWGLKCIVDRAFADQSGVYLNYALFGTLGFVILMAGASYIRLRLVNLAAERVTADLRLKIYRHLLSLDPAFFEQGKTGDQVSRINADTTVLQLVVTSNLPSAFRHLLMLVGGLVMLCVVSRVMTGMVLLSVPLVLAPIIYFGRKVRAKSRETQGRIGDVSGHAQEMLQGIQTIQSYGYEEPAARAFGVLVDDVFMSAKKYIHARSFMAASVIALILGAVGLVLWYGGHKVLSSQMSAGDLSAFIFYAATVVGAVTAISEASGEFNRASGAADRIIQILSARPTLKPAVAGVSFGDVRGDITFDDVSFAYPARPENAALGHVSFEIRAGEVAALVGASGAGKSTVFQLLQRFYDPAGGSILIDGLDITRAEPCDVRALFGVVSQDPAIFSMSVGDNIRLGKPDASDVEVRAAAEQAQAHEFIAALPQGYDTPVGERGSRLSGGQKQRIAIARALLKNPRILLLDEATSALDSANEQAVHLALKSLMKGRTTVVIAHRLSTVRGADRIFVMDKGRIVSSGTHDSLYGKDVLYTHLAGLQSDLKTG